MTHALNWIERLRIERVVWTLDQRLYDLPRASRIAVRRDVRNNLLSASGDVGTSAALRNLGGTRQLAAEYLDAEFGDHPRPAWMVAAVFVLTALLLFTTFLTEATLAFGDGITARDPNATGTYRWSGIAYLQDAVTYTFADGDGEFVGGAMTPLAWVLWIAATVAVGKLWRAPAHWKRRRARRAQRA